MKCEKCGNDSVLVDTSTVLTSNPPQYITYCTSCYNLSSIPCSETKEEPEEEQTFIQVKTATKVLCVEDGSVDERKLNEICDAIGINYIVYRQGSRPPFLIDIN